MTKIPILFELMERKNITQAQLADAIGISRGNLGDWKSGRSSPTIDKLLLLADFFGVSTDYLLGKENTAPEKIPEDGLYQHLKSLTSEELKDLNTFVDYLYYKRSHSHDG
jgi:transcriptional regulator with XRE-family HTH domain